MKLRDIMNQSKQHSHHHDRESRCSKELKRFDFLGHDIRMTFEQKGIFTTNLGAVISIIFGLLLMTVYAAKTMKLVGGDNSTVSMLPMPTDVNQDIDLWDLEYMFANQNVEPRIGRLSV